MFNDCSLDPCQNFGTCTNTSTGFDCTCLDRFYGVRCESYDPCSTDPCLNTGLCSPVTNDTYNCQCVHEDISGNNCQNYDFCKQTPCQNNAKCRLLDVQENILDWNKLRTMSVELDGAAATLQVNKNTMIYHGKLYMLYFTRT